MTMTMKTMRMTFSMVALAAAGFMAGCGGDEHAVEEELCTHLTTGESREIVAAETDAPAVAADHVRYEVSIPGEGDQRTGSVSLVVDHGGGFIFGLDRDIPVQVRRADAAAGDTLAAESVVKGSEACTELAAHHTFDLEVGSYLVTFGPTSEQTVSVVVEHEAHEEEAH